MRREERIMTEFSNVTVEDKILADVVIRSRE